MSKKEEVEKAIEELVLEAVKRFDKEFEYRKEISTHMFYHKLRSFVASEVYNASIKIQTLKKN